MVRLQARSNSVRPRQRRNFNLKGNDVGLTREQFEGLAPTIEKVEIPELNDVAYIRTITARARDAYENSVDDGKQRDTANIGARLVCLCLCDEVGELIYPDAREGATAMGEWSTLIVEPLFHACRKLNRMGRGAVEEAAKNSDSVPNDSSSTDSQQPSG